MEWLNRWFIDGLRYLVEWEMGQVGLIGAVLNWTEWQKLINRVILAALHICTALVLSLAGIVLVRVVIIQNLGLAQCWQSIVQLAETSPATPLCPILLLACVQFGGGLSIRSLILMMLGIMWYVLFNEMKKAQSILTNGLEGAQVYKLSGWDCRKAVILRGIIPDLIAAITIAVGGAKTRSILLANPLT
jgi:ABC-type anion transport system duplicated permease subunit